jgi:DNA-binding transcriptional LysR family regulator
VDFDLRQLEIFCRVVEQGSFTRAAAEVHLAQASVSERIANLERAVGARLLDRLGRKAVPTAVGRRLYERALALLATKREICLELEELLGVEQGILVVGASTIPGEYIMPERIARFRERHPGVLVRVLAGDTAGVVELVAAGEVEAGFVGSMVDSGSVRFEPIWGDELVLAVPARHRLARRKTARLEQLLGEPFVAREPGSGTRRTLERALAESRSAEPIELQVVAELGSTAAVKQAVIQGLGVSILSRRALEIEVRAGAIRALGIPELSLGRHVYLVIDERRTRSPLCARFVDFLRRDRSGSRDHR